MKPSKPKISADTRSMRDSLKIAANNARKLAEEMETPFYVVQDGKLVDLDRNRKRSNVAIGRKNLPSR